MSSSPRTNKPPVSSAPDILGKSQNWVQKVSSIRLSNMRVGQHLTNLLGDKDSNAQSKNMLNDVFHPSFCKLLNIKHGGSVVFVGGKSGIRIWLTSSVSLSHTEYSTDLLYVSEKDERPCIDVCFSEQVDHSGVGCVVVYLLLSMDSGRHMIRPLVIRGDFSSSSHLPTVVPLASLGDQHYDGTANGITCTKRYLMVSQTSTGSVHLLSRQTLRKVGTIPSLGPQRPVVIAASGRWIAIQTTQESVAGTHSGQQVNMRNSEKRSSGNRRSSGSGSGSGGSSVPDVGEAARKVVSGLYSLSQVVSWQVVSPIINAAVQNGHGHKTSRDTSKSDRSVDDKNTEPVGGGVLVIDLGHAMTQDDKDIVVEDTGGVRDAVGDSVDVAVRAHFAAHGSTLGSMTFSPTGLKLASADCFGQVVLVHSLTASGLLSRAHPVISPSGLQYCGIDDVSSPPQLLFKLVRGLSLSSIIDIGFAADESIVFGSTVNGTVHVFDLDQLSALDSASRGHSHGSSLASHSSFKSGSSLTNGGSGSLEHGSLLLQSPPTSTSHVPGSLPGSQGTSSNSTLLTMAASSVTESAFQQYGIPSTDVSQFLSLRRPDLRVLQGYSDIRVKLPLSETFYQHQQHELHNQQNGSNESKESPGAIRSLGEEGDTVGTTSGITGSSYYPQEVNLRSNSLLYLTQDAAAVAESGGWRGSESGGSYELLVGTSEGLLSRFRLTLSSADSASHVTGGQSGVSAVLSNLMPSHTQTTKELNRWDLCAPLTPGGRDKASGSQPRQSRHLHKGSDQPGGMSNFSTWLFAASDIDEPLAAPLWIRPQVKLFTVKSSEQDKRLLEHSKYVHTESIPDQDTEKIYGPPKDDDWTDDEESNNVPKSSKKKKKSKQSGIRNGVEGTSKVHSNTSSETTKSSSSAAGSSNNTLFFPERQVTNALIITRPSTFVYGASSNSQGAVNTPRLDTGVVLEQYIQSALGDSFSDANRGATPIAISMIKHSRPPEDISAWHMDDDWGEDEEDRTEELGYRQGPDIRMQEDC
jgi:hypothetical protein